MRAFLALAALTSTGVEGANPIRRVVTLLQEMSEEISQTLDKERDMHEKFACYCKKNDGELDESAKEAAALIKKTEGEVKAATALKKQLGEEINQHKKERSEGEAKLKAAIQKRQEEKKVYEEATKEQRKTIQQLNDAVSALEQGMGKKKEGEEKAFLQSGVSAAMAASERQLKAISENPTVASALDLGSQQQLMSFMSLTTSKDYAAQSGEIVGILKMIKQNIDESLGGVIQEEEAAVKSFTILKKSLEDLIKSSTQSIEAKMEQKGEASVKIVEGKNLIATTEKQMGEAMASLAALKQACGDKAGEFEERQKDGAAEVEAIHQAIGVLNNDDSLELFKATDTKAFIQGQVSLLQKGTKSDPNAIARAFRNTLTASGAASSDNKSVALLTFSAKQALNQALSSKQGASLDFSKIYKMIDDMVALLKEEASDDLASRDSCNVDLNDNTASIKETENAINGHEATIESLAAAITEAETAAAKNADIISNSKESAAQASKQRTEENSEFQKAVELNKEAVELIAKAKDKLNAYYNPQLVRKTTRVETDEEAADRVSGALIQAHNQAADSAPLPEGQPEMWEEGARKTQGQKGQGVLSLLDTLANDLNKDTQALEHGESSAQEDYERLSADLARQTAQAAQAKNLAEKTRADAENDKVTAESTLSMSQEELEDARKTEADLHAKCDFILSAFDERAGARENEISGLVKAKAVLAGAKFD